MKSELNNRIKQTIDNNMAGAIDLGIINVFFELKNNTQYFFTATP